MGCDRGDSGDEASGPRSRPAKAVGLLGALLAGTSEIGVLAPDRTKCIWWSSLEETDEIEDADMLRDGMPGLIPLLMKNEDGFRLRPMLAMIGERRLDSAAVHSEETTDRGREWLKNPSQSRIIVDDLE